MTDAIRWGEDNTVIDWRLAVASYVNMSKAARRAAYKDVQGVQAASIYIHS